MSRRGSLRITYTARGLERYQMEIWHDELNKYQLIKGITETEVYQKADSKCSQWDEMWDRQSRRDNSMGFASQRTNEALNELEELRNILVYRENNTWKSFKKRKYFKKQSPIIAEYPPIPKSRKYPPEPKRDDRKYKPIITIIDEIFTSRKENKINEKNVSFKNDMNNWKEEIKRIDSEYEKNLKIYEDNIKEIDLENSENYKKWERKKEKSLKIIDDFNNELIFQKEKYFDEDLEIIEKYISMILDNSKYPDPINIEYEFEYIASNKTIIIDYQLPSPTEIPKLKEVKYIQSRDEYVEKNLSDRDFNSIYDEICYQITLRVTYELYASDEGNYIDSIIFNGFINSIDPSTGIEKNSCVLSLQTQKEEFIEIHFDKVESKACFKKFKGVGSSKLHSITPVMPILDISKEDKRFVQGYEVANHLEEGYNVAAMDWKDFENLIRELFEKEFSKNGGEVKVTQSSRDGGVDAIAFDNDPIRGGKIVIQAKRYTNTVGVSAVRDLYGTVLNEGAMKGILITT